MSLLIRRCSSVIAAIFVLVLATSCSPSPAGDTAAGSPSASFPGATAGTAAEQETWPRTITHAKGQTTITAKPKRIVSTSVSLTGNLLALDAPLAGTMATKPDSVGVDSQGFFSQWSKVARERNLKALYEGELDLEAVTAASPDLIVVAATGGDSAAGSYEQLSQIAPVVVVNYSGSDWKQTTAELARATGQEAKYAELVSKYDATIADLGKKTAAPSAPVHAIVFGGDADTAFALPSGPHAQVITGLGFTLAPVPSGADHQSDPSRKDFAFIGKEASVAALTSPDVLFIGDDAEVVKRFKGTTGFSSTKAAQSGKLVALGASTFKLDPYSATDLARALAAAYPRR